MLGAVLPMVTEDEATELDDALPSLATTLHRTTSPLLCRLGPSVLPVAEIVEPPIVQAYVYVNEVVPSASVAVGVQV